MNPSTLPRCPKCGDNARVVSHGKAPGPVTFPFKIPARSYFVLGDNVSNALDSRYWGGLNNAKILGKVPGK
ncbi:MAG: S26 family signal peptidase [Verrucomicrobiota bacterium]